MPSKSFNPGDIVIKSSSKDAHQWPLSADTRIAANEGAEICIREKEACNHAYSVFFASILRFQRIPSVNLALCDSVRPDPADILLHGSF